ncbi:hypothetical protein HMPREF1170_00853 [Aeromonas veronii AMC35]|nr:hypothetical protein HMPREF1170_00853 [Aeromonas veronii AMC35]
MSRPRDRMSSERRRAMDGPSARTVGQAGEPKEPDEVGRISGGGLSFGDFSLATQRKVTRPSPKGGRNPFEASGLASCTAKPCHHTTAPAANAIPRNGRLRLTANRPYDCTAQPCLFTTGTESGWTPGCHRQRGRGRPYRPKKGSQSLNTGCKPACRTAAATSPTGRSSWMANCSSSSASPSA